jgi:plastocyanin
VASGKKREVMRKYFIAVGFIALLAGALAACTGGASGGGSSSGGATLSLSASSFTGATSITITTGQAVTFDDSSGGTHNLVTGTDGKYTAATGAPDEFATSSGLNLSPGEKKTVTFKIAGTYSAQ